MAVFSDDAYNKYLSDATKGGTLIGNWFEERSIREATGEGRTVPQRHIPRSGLLTDWTKVPDAGPRKQDNTFERTCGPKYNVRAVPNSKIIGAGEEDITGEVPIPPLVQAEGRIARVGPRELACRIARREAAEQEMGFEDAERERQANERYFDTTTGSYHCKPDESLSEKAAYLRKSCKLEILHGKKPERSIALQNAGMDIQTNVHYSNSEAPTHARMSLVDPMMRNDMKASACQGFQTFGKNSEFSKPMGECLLGIAKDDELEKLFAAERSTNYMKTRGGVVPLSAPHAGVPSLTLVKDRLHKRLEGVFGQFAYVTLRHQLYDISDAEGFVNKADVTALFRNSVGLSVDEVSDEELDVWLSQLITMKKSDLRISALMSSLRPALSQVVKRRVMEIFISLQPVNGLARLGSWLATIQQEEVRKVVANAFGADDESAVQDVPLTEVTLIELIGDLNPLVDVMSILQ